MRVASLQDTLQGKILAWKDPTGRASKRQKDLLDITRLIEAHPELGAAIPEDILKRLREP